MPCFRRLLTVLALLSLIVGAPAQVPGDSSPADLLERIEREREAVAPEVFEQLGRRGDRAGFKALTAGIVLLDDHRALPKALEAMRHFAGERALAKASVAFLAGEMKQAVLSRRWYATKALAHFGEDGLRELERVANKSPDTYLRQKAVEALLPELARRADADSLRLLMENYDATSDAKAKALRGALLEFGGRGIARAIRAGLEARDLAVDRKVALVQCFDVLPGQEVDAALQDQLAGEDPLLVKACAETLATRGWRQHGRALEKLARRDDPGLRYFAMAALVELSDEDDESWLGKLHAGLEAKRTEERTTALECIVAMRRRSSLPALIDTLAGWRAGGREPNPELATAAAQALRDMTGLDHGTSAERWRRWWEAEGAGFVLPDADAAREAELERLRAAWRREHRYDFYGLTVESERVCFLIDASGSMKSENQRGITRMEIATRQVSDSLAQLGPATRFNVIFFGSRVVSFAEGLVELTPERRAAARAAVLAQKTLGGTALFDGLKAAFASAELSALYLLSDGVPSGGEVDDPKEIRTLVQGWNSAREVPVVIHGIAAGRPSELLRWLAEDSGGRYVEAPDE